VPGYDRTVPPGHFRHSNHRIGAHTCANHTVPYGTALLGWRFPRHFVPGYDRCCPDGTRLQTFRNSIRLVLFAQGLGVRFAVRIKEFLSALLPRRSEFGRGNVPVRAAFLGNGP
jgi:hypothetical protein